MPQNIRSIKNPNGKKDSKSLLVHLLDTRCYKIPG
jgi:hypothetical protein